MNTLTRFALVTQNMRRKPVRTGVLVAIVALFTLTLFSSTLLGQSVSHGTRVMAERLGADILFVPHGYDRKLQGSLLRGEPSSFYLDGAFAKAVRGMPGVGKTSAQLFVASLSASCCTMPVQIIGFDPQTDFTVLPWLARSNGQSVSGAASGGIRQLAASDIIVGHAIRGEPGDLIMLFGKEFTVAAKLDKTGMGFDTSVFMNIQRARQLLVLSDVAELPPGLDPSSFVSSVLIKAVDPAEAKNLANAILRQHAEPYNLDFVLVTGMISDIASKLHGFSLLLYGVSGVIWLLAVAVLALVFSAILHERKKEFGLLRIMGASRWDLARLMLCEATLISCIGALAGLVMTGVLLYSFDGYLAVRLQLPLVWPGLPAVLSTGCAVTTLAVATGPLACLHTVIRLGRMDAYLAVREEA